MNAQDAVDALREHLLGNGWYAVDTGACPEYNEIVVETIKQRYPAVDESPVYKWRRKHKQCRWCTHCYEDLDFDDNKHTIGITHRCKAKGLRIMIPHMYRPFCTLFELKKEKTNADS